MNLNTSSKISQASPTSADLDSRPSPMQGNQQASQTDVCFTNWLTVWLHRPDAKVARTAEWGWTHLSDHTSQATNDAAAKKHASMKSLTVRQVEPWHLLQVKPGLLPPAQAQASSRSTQSPLLIPRLRSALFVLKWLRFVYYFLTFLRRPKHCVARSGTVRPRSQRSWLRSWHRVISSIRGKVACVSRRSRGTARPRSAAAPAACSVHCTRTWHCRRGRLKETRPRNKLIVP